MTDTAPKHPAKFSEALYPVMAKALEGCTTVLDPFAGVGGIHRLREYGYETTGVELEPEWANQHPDTIVGDALDLPFEDGSFSAVCTSPSFGNRMADSHDAKDGSYRRTYTHVLGRKLSDHNSGAMQWGPVYAAFHQGAWAQAVHVLELGGKFVLNIKDHQRHGKRQYVGGWHVSTLVRLGCTLLYHEEVPTPGFRMGANRAERYPEYVYVLEKTT